MPTSQILEHRIPIGIADLKCADKGAALQSHAQTINRTVHSFTGDPNLLTPEQEASTMNQISDGLDELKAQVPGYQEFDMVLSYGRADEFPEHYQRDSPPIFRVSGEKVIAVRDVMRRPRTFDENLLE